MDTCRCWLLISLAVCWERAVSVLVFGCEGRGGDRVVSWLIFDQPPPPSLYLVTTKPAARATTRHVIDMFCGPDGTTSSDCWDAESGLGNWKAALKARCDACGEAGGLGGGGGGQKHPFVSLVGPPSRSRLVLPERADLLKSSQPKLSTKRYWTSHVLSKVIFSILKWWMNRVGFWFRNFISRIVIILDRSDVCGLVRFMYIKRFRINQHPTGTLSSVSYNFVNKLVFK